MLAQRIDNITRGWLEEGREEGLEKGREEGLEKGRLEGAAHMFLEFLANKHGPVSAEVRKRVASASEEKLETWAKRLLEAESPEDVFKD